MKVCFKNNNKSVTSVQIKVIKKFVKFLQTHLPLKKDITVNFVSDRSIKMTTGVRYPNGKLFVLAGNRLLIDILRTLSHEWVHEFQHQKMGLKDNQKIQDIGGPEENMCNILSGVFIKKFEKEFPKYSKFLYGGGKEGYFQDEMDEIERAAQDLSRDDKFQTSVKDILKVFNKAKETKLDNKVWNKLENTESNEIKKGDMNKVVVLAKKYNKSSPLKLKDALLSGEYRPPLILKFGDRYHLVAGNTRLCTSAALGLNPKVIIGELV